MSDLRPESATAGAATLIAAPNSMTNLSALLPMKDTLTLADKQCIVGQALILLSDFYVHLSSKKAMYAIDPIQRLRLLQRSITERTSDNEFHRSMAEIFTSVRDLHTNYFLPAPYPAIVAVLPFLVEVCASDEGQKFIVTHLINGFTHPTFIKGVEIVSWSGVSIRRAVELLGEQTAGGNLAARTARGISSLTVRPLMRGLAPDEAWVLVGYKNNTGDILELRFNWLGMKVIEDGTGAASGLSKGSAVALGLDIELEASRYARKHLFAPDILKAEANVQKLGGPQSAFGQVTGLQSVMPDIFEARVVDTPSGSYGYVRLRSFNVEDPDLFVKEFTRLVSFLPDTGLILDVRDNGGGLIFAGERLLQTITPVRIHPERLQMINTPSTLELCRRSSPSVRVPEVDLSLWLPSAKTAFEIGATFTAAFPITAPTDCNSLGQQYQGPVVLVINALCYSTTDFFIAGFRDHGIGAILGVDANTGAGGANVWTHDLLRDLFQSENVSSSPGDDMLFQKLPHEASFSVAIRRSLRVGAEAGTIVEDLGVTPDEIHMLTERDVLSGNEDLINRAASLLSTMPAHILKVMVEDVVDGKCTINVTNRNCDRLDVYQSNRPIASFDISAERTQLELRMVHPVLPYELEFRGFTNGHLTASKRLEVSSLA